MGNLVSKLSINWEAVLTMAATTAFPCHSSQKINSQIVTRSLILTKHIAIFAAYRFDFIFAYEHLLEMLDCKTQLAL